ncbi:acyl-CoA dehydrogenase family protein [Williamsia muralis]|uniref:acyl-CoA dehydrogenase family protein n=1 Tax=Williamsia marianensis TaxID=85044 RepID=UPI000787E5A4|nr:acyl-CoA dehydrogenase family protein [Williamsia muralis]
MRVPSSAVLGSPGQGLKTFLSTFNTSRLGNASELIGLARRGFIEAVDYAGAREVGKNVVTDFQRLQWELTDCYQAISAAIRFRDEAATMIASGADPSFATSLAKSAAIDAAELTGKVMFGLVGGHGLYNDQPYWRTLADIKVLRTAGGSREVLRNFIAKQILRSDDLGGLR